MSKTNPRFNGSGNISLKIFENSKSRNVKLNANNINLYIASKEPDEILYLDKCLLSFKDEEIMFSNFLNKDKIYVDPYIESSIKHIVEKPQDIFINNKAINFDKKMVKE